MSLKVVCAGAGWVTRERHLPALQAEPRVEVIGIVDPNAERAERVAKDLNLPHFGTSLDEPWTEAADCLTVGTPPLTHAAQISIALDRGWHCLSEKPFALPPAEAAALVERARETERTLCVVHNFQFSRSGARLFEIVESGKLGAIEAVYAFQLSNPKRRLPTWYQSLPGGLFLDESPHLLYLLRRVLGGRLDVRALDARLDGTEIRDLVATFEHETIWASLSMSFGASVSEWQFVVVGTESVAALDIFRDILLVLPNDGGHRAREILRTSGRAVGGHLAGVLSSGVRMTGKRLSYGNNEVVGRFVDAVEGRTERARWMTGEDGYEVVACIADLLGRAGIEV
ncbi:MAG TPA: Gfo/Idh/MocA family oxidoreductase [Gaiellaceae bacterium]|jgi:predicted dehydrogenase|nr:Gfo/Idh/MocA family oxidoreductase [Gaiellaceae bacterium]